MWTTDDIPDLSGKTALVTGANSGIGLATALHLARRGARVIMTARDRVRGQVAVERVKGAVPEGKVELRILDLADLASVRALADGFDEPLDLLVNNAGVALIPRQTTADGFESQFGVNHLGHFALTGLLLPLLLERRPARVVTVSSDAHAMGRIDFDDLGLENGYGRLGAYSRSKLANMLFTLELQRLAGDRLLSLVVHPGPTATSIIRPGAFTRPLAAFMRLTLKSPEKGALPSLYAATAPDVSGGLYVGPGPRVLTPAARARDEDVARRLWNASEELTGVRFTALAARP
ncbi:oxidoreductase [Streptosporangium saharense]|uniref:oxidoreductase n=1 Tax=Streptosporangium saharense TaxID=1706840 RepID=UPI0036AD4D67